MVVLGEEKLRLNLNFVGTIRTERAFSISEIRSLLRKLVRIYTEGHSEYYEPLIFPRHEDYPPYARQVLGKVAPILFRRKRTRLEAIELRQVLIFWIQPDLVIFIGERKDVNKAVKHFRLALKELGVPIEFEVPRFPPHYMLYLFEKVQKYRKWSRDSGPVPEGKEMQPPKLARGVELLSIRDVSSEWEKESDQAKLVSAKKARDSTADITTQITILQGRGLKDILMHVVMEHTSRFVRIQRGGFLRVLKKTVRKRKSARTEDRLLWALEFATRLVESYYQWIELPVDKHLVSDDVYLEIRSNVQVEMQEVIESIDERLSNLDAFRQELKRDKRKKRKKAVELR